MFQPFSDGFQRSIVQFLYPVTRRSVLGVRTSNYRFGSQLVWSQSEFIFSTPFCHTRVRLEFRALSLSKIYKVSSTSLFFDKILGHLIYLYMALFKHKKKQFLVRSLVGCFDHFPYIDISHKRGEI